MGTALHDYKRVEDRSSLIASIWLGVMAAGLLLVWALWLDVVLPVHNLIRLALLAVGLSIGVGALCYRPRRRAWWRNAAFVAAVVVSLVGVATLPSQAEIEVRDYESELVAAAESVLANGFAGADGCVAAPAQLSAGDLGPFDQLCVIRLPPHGGVEFRHSTPGHTEGLVYLADKDTSPPQSTCIRELFGHWSQFSRPADPDCPFGYHYIGGG